MATYDGDGTAQAASGERDAQEAPPPEFEYLVRGQVLYRHGLPIAGREVVAVHRNLRSEVELGRARTDEAGSYEIYYNVDRVAGRAPDLQTRVYDEQGKEVLASSAVRFSAARISKLRIQVEGGPEKTWSEYEQLMAEVGPALEDVALDAVDEPDVVLLAGKTAQPADRVATLVVAHKLSARTGVAPEVFYGLARQNVATNLSALLASDEGTRRRALERAVHRRVVPGRLLGELDGIDKQIRGSIVSRGADAKQDALGAILSNVLPKAGERTTFLRRYAAFDGPPERFWSNLRRTGAFAEKVDDLQYTVQLSALTGAHEPLVRHLLGSRGREGFRRLEELASLDQKAWEGVIREQQLADGESLVPASIPGGDDDAKVRLYAQTLDRVVSDVLPTETVAYAAAADDGKPSDVRRFWQNVTGAIEAGDNDLQLGAVDVPAYLSGKAELLRGVRDVDAVTGHVQSVQRLFNLTTAPSEIDALMATDLPSAEAVVRLGSGSFMQRFGPQLGGQRAAMIFNKAEHVTATKMAVLGRVDPQFNQTDLHVLAAPQPKQVPSLATLFGSYDTCACGHCRSVAGPAACLAEALAFLGERRLPAPATGTALDVLFRRRPDLGELELTCDNTDTVLPYVDLVNEVLERAVAPFAPFALPQARVAELDARTVSDLLRGNFATAGRPLSAEHFVIVIVPGQHWLLTDHSTLYVLRNEGGQLTVGSATPQTGAPADQLAANPEHTWAPAYALLRDAVHPWTLPLDQWREEVVTHVGHLGAPRHELMDELSPGDHFAALRRPEIAAEQLGFSAKRRSIVTGTLNPARPWEFYGLRQTANAIDVFDPADPSQPRTASLAWEAALAWVEPLLARTELSYEQLVTLLGTGFVNPGTRARIVSADPGDPTSCELRKLTVTGADGALFERLHRFVVAWRQLGWDPHELDRAIAAIDRGVRAVDARLSDTTLLGLAHLDRLRARLGLGVVELLALWAPISTVDSEPDAKDSPYLTLFQNPAVLQPVDPDFALSGGEVAIAGRADARLSRHVPTLLAAFEISAAELTTLAQALVPGDELTVASLSALYRRALLARGLGIDVPDLLALVAITGLDPFSGATHDTVWFVELADLVAGAGLSVPELDYLLNHRGADAVEWAPLEPDVAAVLDELRAALRKVHEETAPRPDPAGDVTRSLLAQLRWPADLVGDAADTLAGTVVYRAPLAALPADASIPPSLADRVAYDAAASELTIAGPLSNSERTLLRNGSRAAAWGNAVDALHQQPRAFVEQRMRAYEFPTFSAALDALPGGTVVPEPLARRVYFDAAARQLRADGVLTDADKAALDALSADAAYRAAVQTLHDAPATFAPEPGNVFYAAGGAGELFDVAQTPAQRFEKVAGRVLAHLREQGCQRAVCERTANALGTGVRDAQQLLTGVVHADGSTTAWALSDLVSEPFATSNPGIPLTAAAFPAQFRTWTRIVKSAHLAAALRLTPAQAAWYLAFGVSPRTLPWLPGVDAAWLTADAIPVGPAAPSPQRFGAWTRLREATQLAALLPGGFATLTAVMEKARRPLVPARDQRGAVLDTIAAQTGWDRADLDTLATILGLTLPADAADETGLVRLARGQRRMRQLGASPQQLAAFALPEPTDADAKAARQLVKAKYPDATWAEVAKPLRDTLRDRQREALVAYLTRRPDAARGQRWSDANGLYEHFLIDCEMSACALTSRLKQALGSVQQFVQRCLLNLEPEVTADTSSDAGWVDWKWMKNYRVWEANRLVFMYPENLLEPELRDDASPLFQAAQGELLQDDITAEVAEQVFLGYLEGLDAVARLEIAGLYLQAASEGRPEVLHVFGRTYGTTTPQHYYRRRIDGRWTAWETVDLDITARQLLPIVWNRRLFLFWPVFTEVSPSAIGDRPVAPDRRFEIQLAWSELRRGEWRPKRVTPRRVVANGVRPDDSPDRGTGRFALRAGIDVQGLKVWYEIDDVPPRVWVPGSYPNPGHWTGGLDVDGWLFTGAEGKTEPFRTAIGGIYQPTGTDVDGMAFVERGASALNLPKVVSSGEAVVLANTPGQYELAYLHQDAYITGLRPFFYADDARTYCVESVEGWTMTLPLTRPERLDLATIDDFRRLYYEPVIIRDPEIIDPIGPKAVRGVVDPVPIARVVIGRAAGYRDSHDYLGIPGAAPLPTLSPGTHAATFDLATDPTVFLPKLKREIAEVEQLAARELTTRALRVQPRDTFVVSKGDKSVVSIAEFIDDKRLDRPIVMFPLATRVRRYVFKNFFHPYTTPFLKALDANGVDALLERRTQLQSAATFRARYAPTDAVSSEDDDGQSAYPIEEVDFSFGGAYSLYNWELFFHLPLLIATRLTQSQRFEEAQRWLHFVFDPTDASDPVGPRRFWRTRPFYEESQADVQAERIETIVRELADGTPDAELSGEVDEWRRNPFKPHAIARLRITAYQKNVVMRYLDNVIAWGDQLFRRDTIESINEATQLYVLAAEILGRRPNVMPPRAEPQTRTFSTLHPSTDAFSDRLVDIEYLFGGARPDSVVHDASTPPLPLPQTLYFCVPPNDKLLGYWDTVEDRLFKIRHCMNIEGTVRQLPLFEPPIDPALLVRAAAAGVDISAALSDAGAPLPIYRFSPLLAKAKEFAGEVKALGASLLSALESRDAEQLALLRATNEIALQESVETIRLAQVEEAEQQIATQRRARDTAVARWTHYQKLLGKRDVRAPEEGRPVPDTTASAAVSIVSDTGAKLIAQEKNELERLATADAKQEKAGNSDHSASIAFIFPSINISVMPWGIGLGTSFGGPNVGAGFNASAARSRTDATSEQNAAGRASRIGSYVLREQDWVLQANLAAKEIMHIDAQIAGATLRRGLADSELASHRRRIENARAEHELMTSRYTNEQLRVWLIGRISEVYFQAYRLAYDVAKRAERAYRFELGLSDSSFVQFGYWDSLRKGLTAGEQLLHDLHRMEAAHLEQNRREHELVKHVSLNLLHPEALVELRETGSCMVELPEAIFDLDHPGHYMRRIKSVSLSIPCTAGPYTNVSCKLTLLANRVRRNASLTPQYAWQGPGDARFGYDAGGVDSIVTSSAREDAGMFSLDFGDERYLPFEGAGAVSAWRLELPAAFRQFDYESISDVVLRVSYTARDGGSTLRTAAGDDLAAALRQMELEPGTTGPMRLLSARTDYPDAFARLLQLDPVAGAHTLAFDLDGARFPAYVRDRSVRVTALAVHALLRAPFAYDDADPLVVTVKPPGNAAAVDVTLLRNPALAGGLPAGLATFGRGVAVGATAGWTVTLKQIPAALGDDVEIDGRTVRRLKAEALGDVGLLLGYTF